MNVIILEDEKLPASRLRSILREIDPKICVIAELSSVQQAAAYFSRHRVLADALLADVDLEDPPALELFRQLPDLKIPIIFTANSDQYAIDAFKVLCVDYLLKPVTFESLSKALYKLELLKGGFGGSQRRTFKARLLGKIGQRWYFIHTQDIALISAENRVVHIIDMDKSKYMVDYTLDELEHELEPFSFFRINRSTIVHSRAIEQAKPFLNHRLKLILKNPLQAEEVVVSRDRVADFKRWAEC